MNCNKCHAMLIEVVRYDGDRRISSRLSCPVCENDWQDREDLIDTISSRLFDRSVYV
ncbi:MAG: hypothetical protein ACOZF0_11790 [Thermodesulfobacteriota bacterium]